MLIKFVGKRLRYEGLRLKSRPEDPRKIPRLRRSGILVFQLPSGEEQLEGFEYAQANELLRRWPAKFKRVIRKGDRQ